MPGPGHGPQGPGHAPVPGLPQGYPVLNAELSAQIATGASVFPSDPPRGGPPGPMPPGPVPMGGPGGARGPEAGPAGVVGARGSEPGGVPGMLGMPGAPIGGYPQGAQPPPRDGSFDPQRAAGMMSPVGQQYPESVDWNAMAARPARAVPPWMLAVLFVGAIGVALALTILIARLVR